MSLKKIILRIGRIRFYYNTNLYRLKGVKIGKRSYIYSKVTIETGGPKIIIGEKVHIARGTTILSRMPFKEVDHDKKTMIEDNVRIFINAIIFPGVKIGKNSIIGAGSVVTKDVPCNVVVMGNPARVIKNI